MRVANGAPYPTRHLALRAVSAAKNTLNQARTHINKQTEVPCWCRYAVPRCENRAHPPPFAVYVYHLCTVRGTVVCVI